MFSTCEKQNHCKIITIVWADVLRPTKTKTNPLAQKRVSSISNRAGAILLADFAAVTI